MADIELVIKLDEEVYKYAKKYNDSYMLALREMDICMKAIANGQLLPKDCEILTREAYEDLCMRANCV